MVTYVTIEKQAQSSTGNYWVKMKMLKIQTSDRVSPQKVW